MRRQTAGYDAAMPSIEKTRNYALAPAQLWVAVADLRAWDQWLTVLKEWRSEPPAELTMGVELEATISVMSIPMAVTWTVQEAEPPRTLTMSGPAVLNSEVTLRTDVRPTDSGSDVTIRIEVDNPMLVGPLADTLMNAVSKDMDESMANLESYLDDRGVS